MTHQDNKHVNDKLRQDVLFADSVIRVALIVIILI